MLIQDECQAVSYVHHSLIFLSLSLQHTDTHILFSLTQHFHFFHVFIFICLSVSLTSFPHFRLQLCFFSFSLCLAVNSLPLVLKLLCVMQASDPPLSSSYSKMDGVHFKLLYHGEVKSSCWQVIITLLPSALIC